MIVKMLHLDLVCAASDREATLKSLRDLGAVHLDLNAAQGAAVMAAKGEGADAEKAVRLILKARGKTPKTDIDIRERSVACVLALDDHEVRKHGRLRARLDGQLLHRPHQDDGSLLHGQHLRAAVHIGAGLGAVAVIVCHLAGDGHRRRQGRDI